MVHSFRAAVAEARRHGDLYFAALLSQDRIEKAFGTARWLWQGWVYTPAVTVWVFLSQCLSPDHSCRDAVARLIAWRVARGLKPCSAEPALIARHETICRKKPFTDWCATPASRSRTSRRRVGFGMGEESAPWTAPPSPCPTRRRIRRPIRSMKTQKPGCGFPIARILVVFSLSVGTVLEAAIGKYKGKQTGENSLFRQLYHVAGRRRYYPGGPLFQRLVRYCLAACNAASTWSFANTNSGERTFARASDWAKTITWFLGTTATAEMDVGRAVRHTARQVDVAGGPHPRRPKGFRTRTLVVVTTLLDAETISGRRNRFVVPPSLAGGASLAKHQDRTANGPFALQDSAPGSQRVLHAPAGLQSDPRRDGGGRLPVGQIAVGNQFQGGAANAQSVSSPALVPGGDRTWCQALLTAVATHAVGNRPDRFEPRRLKRPQKPYGLLQKHRHLYTIRDEKTS